MRRPAVRAGARARSEMSATHAPSGSSFGPRLDDNQVQCCACVALRPRGAADTRAFGAGARGLDGPAGLALWAKLFAVPIISCCCFVPRARAQAPPASGIHTRHAGAVAADPGRARARARRRRCTPGGAAAAPHGQHRCSAPAAAAALERRRRRRRRSGPQVAVPGHPEHQRPDGGASERGASPPPRAAPPPRPLPASAPPTTAAGRQPLPPPPPPLQEGDLAKRAEALLRSMGMDEEADKLAADEAAAAAADAAAATEESGGSGIGDRDGPLGGLPPRRAL